MRYKYNTTIRIANMSVFLKEIHSYSFQVSYTEDKDRKSVYLPYNQLVKASNSENNYSYEGPFADLIDNLPNHYVEMNCDIDIVLPDEARAIVPFVQISGKRIVERSMKKPDRDYYFQDTVWLESQILRTIGKPEFYTKRIDWTSKKSFFPNLMKQTLSRKHLQPFNPEEIYELHSFANMAVMDAATLFNPAQSNRFVAVASRRIKFAFQDLWSKDNQLEKFDHKRQKAFMEIRNYIDAHPNCSIGDITANTIATEADYFYYDLEFLHPAISLDSTLPSCSSTQTAGRPISDVLDDPALELKDEDYRAKITKVLVEEGFTPREAELYIYSISVPAETMRKEFSLPYAKLKELKMRAKEAILKHPAELNPNYRKEL